MEFVYVLKRYDLFDLEFPHGFCCKEEDGFHPALLDRIKTKGFFIERAYTENDSSFKQIIPYSIVTHGDHLLVLRRTDQQGEVRLHNKRSIGVGGHINPIDNGEDTVLKACIREVEEELQIDEDYEPVPLGVINDESNAVGSVHFGVVYLIRLAKGDLKVRETSMMEAEFIELDLLREQAADQDANFESWSSLIVDALSPSLLQSKVKI